jgi:hypothetical protein
MPTPPKSAAKYPHRSVTADLTDRIFAMIPERPEIMAIHEPRDLFGVPGFYCADLAPSQLQMETALDIAKRQYQEQNP